MKTADDILNVSFEVDQTPVSDPDVTPEPSVQSGTKWYVWLILAIIVLLILFLVLRR